jgi:hypothetical protein
MKATAELVVTATFIAAHFSAPINAALTSHDGVASASTRNATVSNALPRLDTTGAVVDAHSGNIVGPINGTYFLYGEW